MLITTSETEIGWLKMVGRAVVVSQLVERSLPTPEVRGSNPVRGPVGPLKTVGQWFWLSW